MKKATKFLMGLMIGGLFSSAILAQSNHTVSFSGASSDFNAAEKLYGGDNVDYYVTFDESNLYIGAFRVNSNTFGNYDHFTVYVDSDPEFTPTNGTGSTTGINWDSNTPILPFTANYRLAGRKGDGLGDSFYSSYSGSWSTGAANSESWTQYISSTAIEIAIPWSDLGDPESIYLTMYMSYNGGFFGASDGSFPVSISSSTVSGYFGLIPVKSDVTPLEIQDSPGQTITGSEGWRILSSPTSDNSYDDLLGGLWTQGIATGADATNGDASVQTFDGSSFSAVSDLTANMTAGTGFITYVYSDDDYDENPEGFPKTISVDGTENSGDQTPAVSSGNLEWSLVGNPFASTIDADDFTYTDMFSTVYVYDHSYGTPGVGDSEASGSAGSYRVWNGAAGSLTDGLIAPFQGFWVQNTTTILAAAELTIPESSKTSGGTFYKAVKTPVVELKVEQDGRYSTAYFSFTADGELAKDGRDALKLLPLDHKDYISISSLVGDTEMDINNLPAELDEEVQVALNIKSFDAVESGWAEKAGEFTVSWPQFENIPEDWKVTLTDHETGQSIDLRTEESYSFQVTEVSENIMEKSAFSMLSPATVTKQKGAYDDRFVITITPNFSIVDIEENSSPEEFTLSQNYPNPFNPSTNIRYSVAEAGDVTLSVFNLMGQKVAELVNENKAAGTYSVSWNASGMASGMYYYRLASAGQTLTRKMTLIK